MAGAGPVVVSPNLHGDCYGAAVELARAGADVRIVGWQHSDIAYDTHVLRWYAQAIARFVAVSGAVERRLALAMPQRAGDIAMIPYGAPAPARAPRRDAIDGRPVRLLYAGRLDHAQKRVGALGPMMAALAEAGVGAHLTVAGDGPARGRTSSSRTAVALAASRSVTVSSTA
jgi:glycosyltransferase involved in cell wall biosynthesis